MKVKEYIKKYNLKTTKLSSSGKNELIKDLSMDFLSMLDFYKESPNQAYDYTRFKICVSQIKDKLDSIQNKSISFGSPKESVVYWEKLWKYFYASFIVKIRDKEFGEYLNNKKKAYEERQKYYYDPYADFVNDFWSHIYDNVFNSLKKMCDNSEAMTPYLDILGIDPIKEPPSREIVIKKYRELVKVHHPDAGGDRSTFEKITNAKNELLLILN